MGSVPSGRAAAPPRRTTVIERVMERVMERVIERLGG
jgi:hypothetical protein